MSTRPPKHKICGWRIRHEKNTPWATRPNFSCSFHPRWNFWWKHAAQAYAIFFRTDGGWPPRGRSKNFRGKPAAFQIASEPQPSTKKCTGSDFGFNNTRWKRFPNELRTPKHNFNNTSNCINLQFPSLQKNKIKQIQSNSKSNGSVMQEHPQWQRKWLATWDPKFPPRPAARLCERLNSFHPPPTFDFLFLRF